MAPVVAVFGYGPGISTAVAQKFGKEGFKAAIVARTASKLEKAAEELKASGIEAAAFPADLNDLSALEKVFSDIKATLGPVTVLVWNQYAHVLEPPLGQTPEQLTYQYSGIPAFVRAIQLAVPQLESQAGPDAGVQPAILVTGGGFSQTEIEPVQAFVASVNAQIPASISAAKHSLVATFRHTLAPKGIRVGEVMVTSQVKGTAFDGGQAKLEASTVAEAFWKQAKGESESWYVKISE